MTYEYDAGAFALAYEGRDQPPCCDDCRIDSCDGGCGALNVLYPVGKTGLQDRLTQVQDIVMQMTLKGPDQFDARVGYWAKKIHEVINPE